LTLEGAGLDEIAAELAADAARPLKIKAVDRDSGEVVEGVVFRDHAIAAGLDELSQDDVAQMPRARSPAAGVTTAIATRHEPTWAKTADKLERSPSAHQRVVVGTNPRRSISAARVATIRSGVHRFALPGIPGRQPTPRPGRVPNRR
jgi:hypothetical protein